MEEQEQVKPEEVKPEETQEAVLDATVFESTNTITLTKSGFTLRWAAPEVVMDEFKGIEADIWSFGWVCYEVSPLPSRCSVRLRLFTGHDGEYSVSKSQE